MAILCLCLWLEICELGFLNGCRSWSKRPSFLQVIQSFSRSWETNQCSQRGLFFSGDAYGLVGASTPFVYVYERHFYIERAMNLHEGRHSVDYEQSYW